MADETVEVEQTEEETQEEQFYGTLKEQFGDSAPSKSDVDLWKAQSGRVRLVPFADNEVYFIRPIKRSEYRGLIQTLGSVSGENTQNEDLLREHVVTKCTLWPSLKTEQFAGMPAGTLESLYDAIMDASNFMSQQMLMTLVREL